MEELSRRDFLKLSGGTTAGLVLFGKLGSFQRLSTSVRSFSLKKKIGEKISICPYDATGCGFIIASEGGKITNIEGDPEHPINRGGACSKGASLYQIANNERRLSKVLYRAPNGTKWEEKSWEWALDEIAKKIKATRDTNWKEKDKDGYVVNRTEAIASLGGAGLDNEECYLLSKAMRALGLVYLEHQARL